VHPNPDQSDTAVFINAFSDDIYATFNKTILYDSSINLKAKGLHFMLQALMPNTLVTTASLLENCTDGIKSIYASIKMLMKSRYLYRVRLRKTDGTLGPVAYVSYPVPTQITRSALEDLVCKANQHTTVVPTTESVETGGANKTSNRPQNNDPNFIPYKPENGGQNGGQKWVPKAKTDVGPNTTQKTTINFKNANDYRPRPQKGRVVPLIVENEGNEKHADFGKFEKNPMIPSTKPKGPCGSLSTYKLLHSDQNFDKSKSFPHSITKDLQADPFLLGKPFYETRKNLLKKSIKNVVELIFEFWNEQSSLQTHLISSKTKIYKHVTHSIYSLLSNKLPTESVIASTDYVSTTITEPQELNTLVEKQDNILDQNTLNTLVEKQDNILDQNKLNTLVEKQDLQMLHENLLKIVEDIKQAILDYNWLIAEPFTKIKGSARPQVVGLDEFFKFSRYSNDIRSSNNHPLHGIESWFVECSKGREYLGDAYAFRVKEENSLVTEKLLELIGRERLFGRANFDNLPVYERNVYVKAANQLHEYVLKNRHKLPAKGTYATCIMGVIAILRKTEECKDIHPGFLTSPHIWANLTIYLKRKQIIRR